MFDFDKHGIQKKMGYSCKVMIEFSKKTITITNKNEKNLVNKHQPQNQSQRYST